MDFLNTNTIWASLFWGSVGAGFFIYGKKQTSLWPMLGGVALIAVSYFIPSPLWMSLVSVAVIVAIYFLSKRGD
ncbi:MAG: hypothetical protein EXS35_14605 [Pedosphaera sp.]|nr:hypothetical protein [Pedosphaera sp.]